MLLTRVLAILVLGGVARHSALAGDIPLTGANFPIIPQIDSSTPSLPDFLAGVIRQRAAAADEEMARFREWSAATAQLEAQMANSSSYEPPKVQTAAAGWPRKIVNLKKGPSPPQPLNLNAKGARYTTSTRSCRDAGTLHFFLRQLVGFRVKCNCSSSFLAGTATAAIDIW